MMKKKFVLALACVLVLSLTACGEKKVDETKVATASAETAKDKQEEKATENSTVSEEQAAEAPVKESKEEAQGQKHYEAMQEILDANFEDFKFQVDDKLFQYRIGLTVEEYMALLPEGCVLVETKNMKEVDFSRIIAKDDLDQYYIKNPNREEIRRNTNILGSIAVRNETGDVSTLGQATVRAFSFDESYTGDIYMAKGLVLNWKSPEGIYKLQEDDRFSFANIAKTFEGYGIEGADEKTFEDKLSKEAYTVYTTNDKIKYALFVFMKEGTITDTWGEKAMISFPGYALRYEVDLDTGMCKYFHFEWFPGNTGWVDPTEYGFPAN